MSVKTIDYRQQLAQDTSRGPSRSIWSYEGPNAGIEDFFQDPYLGAYTIEEWNPAPNFSGGSFTGGFGQWSIFSTANGAVADDQIAGGGLRLKASTTANQGVTLSSSTGGYQMVNGSGVLQGKLAYECRVLVSTGSFTNSTQDTFLGLTDNLPCGSNVPISSTPGTLAASTNFIGFHKRGGTTNANDWGFVFGASGQTIVYPTGLNTLITTVLGTAPVVGTYYKLGFVFDPTPTNPVLQIATAASSNQTVGNKAVPMLRVFVNGLQAAAFLIKSDITATNFPNGTFLAPCYAFLQQSTTAGIYSSNDWIRAAQTLLA